MQGWVDLCYVKADRLGIEPATCQSQVQHLTAAPPRSTCWWCMTIVQQSLDFREPNCVYDVAPYRHEKTSITSRKYRQSYRHADPRRQQQQTATAARVTSNRATVTVFVTLTFDLWVNACRATTIEYMSTKFGVDSSSLFPFRARTNRQTNRQTRMNALPTPAAIQPAWVNILSRHCITQKLIPAVTICRHFEFVLYASA